MQKSTSDRLSNGKVWQRGFLMVVYAIIGWLVRLVICFIALFQFGHLLFTDRVNLPLKEAGLSLSQYLYQISLYLSFNSDQLPFPMSAWPGQPEPADEVVD